MFVDHIRHAVWNELRARSLRAFTSILTPQIIEEAAYRAGVTLGGGPLCLFVLVWLGIACALHPDKRFSAVLRYTLDLLHNEARWDPSRFIPAGTPTTKSRKARRRSKHDPRGSGDPFEVSNSAFTQARQAMPWKLWIALIAVLAENLEEAHPGIASVHGFRLLALDGTTLELDRWEDLRHRAGAAANGKALSSPRARLVLLQLPLVRVPLAFDLVPYTVGERTAAMPLLEVVRRNDLVLIDRGFWGTALFSRIMQRDAFFAIRLVSGVEFTTTRRLGTNDRLAVWTPTKRQKDSGDGVRESFELRLIKYQIKGFRPSTLVTSVNDPKRISREEFVRVAVVDEAGRVLEPGLYHRRWEIETSFRELKVTQKMAGSFRSRTCEGIGFEVGGHLLLYTLVRMLIVKAAVRVGISPLRLSYSDALNELKTMDKSLVTASGRHAERKLRPRLLELIGSHEVPLRPGRHYPRPGDMKPKTDKHGKKQLPHKVCATIRRIVMRKEATKTEDETPTVKMSCV